MRDQPGWIFIGTLTFLTGLSYTLGLAASGTISQVLDLTWLRVWGGFLTLSGALVVISTLRSMRPLERLALRLLSLCLLVYMGWILVAAPLNRAALTIMMGSALIGLSEIRVAVLRTLLRPLPAPPQQEVDRWEE